ncbi:MAG: four-carbon acid sugar kinase family protein, partial [Ilumatobacteraceae bacterium]
MRQRSALLMVTADDSTGATEAGAACADTGLSVLVVPFGSACPSGDCTVIDLRSRHLDPDEARRRIAASTGAAHRVHKIDSTLRGNWSHELAALVDAGRRVVLIPSHPMAGRVCRGGVVYVNDVPVANSDLANDPRLPVRSSRPSEALPGPELTGRRSLATWLTGSDGGVAIVDAESLDDIDELVELALGFDDVVLGGPASVVGAVARLSAPADSVVRLPVPLLPKPVVVVCASLHPVSRAQIARVADAGFDVVTSPEERIGDSQSIATEVASRAHRLVAQRRARSVVLVGGDTAEAFIGDNVVRIFGSID